ncbi:MAG: protease inhibitor I42 family protein [Thermodesulfobacteriota bacterium]
MFARSASATRTRSYVAAAIVSFVAFTLFSAAEARAQAETVRATVNKVFSISLPENPSTGYSWEGKVDTRFLSLKGRNFARSAKSESLVGGGGTVTYFFLPLKPGQTELVLRSKRPWEKEPKEEKKYRIVISR